MPSLKGLVSVSPDGSRMNRRGACSTLETLGSSPVLYRFVSNGARLWFSVQNEPRLALIHCDLALLFLPSFPESWDYSMCAHSCCCWVWVLLLFICLFDFCCFVLFL